MNNKIPLISYTFAALAGICFIRGLVILSSEGRYPECTDLRNYYRS